MKTKKSIAVFCSITVTLVWLFGSAIQAEAASKNFKYFGYPTKVESFSVGDVDGHTINFQLGKTFWWFEDGDIAVSNHVVTSDWIKFSGPFTQYAIWKFADGSTITIKVHGSMGGEGASFKSEILKGTGRFEGAKGGASSKAKFLPPEKGDVGPVNYGEGTLTYTLPAR